jgi:regulation of enolase protein 1 (concanavalin A-like superfamily)
MWNMHMEGNTFINGSSSVGATDGGVFFTAPGTSSVYTGCTFKSNIIIQTNGKPLLNAAPSSMVFANNCWTSTPPSGAGSAGDLVNASLGISMSGFSGTGGTLTKEYFRPIAGSNVLGKGAILPDTTPDFEGVTRSNLTPTAGALETPIGGSGVTDWLTTITPFSSANVGDTWANGTFHKSPTTGQYRIVASGGTDIFGSADGMSALYINVTGDFDFKCRVVQFNSTIEYAKIGIDVRATLDAGSEHYALVKQMNELNVNGLSRVSVGATTSQNYLTGTGANNWLRVRKTGSSLEFMYGIDGVTWTTESTKTLTGWSDSVYACMVACSKSPTLTATAIFDNVSLVQSLPYPWASADVGAVVIAGSSQYASGVYTVNGAGADIWGTVDAFHYVYRQYTGDFDAKVRIPTGPTPITNNYAKAGLMARGSLANNAANIIVTLLPIGSVESVARSTDGGDSFVRERVTDASKWVRLVRQGNVFKTYYSSDGATWTALSTDLTLTLPSTVYLGLAVCSHNTTALTTATFDNISIGAVSSNVSQMFLLDM